MRHGDHVTMGYWQKPKQTAQVFDAKLVEPAPASRGAPWLRTGDPMSFPMVSCSSRPHQRPAHVTATITPDDIARQRSRRSPVDGPQIAVPDGTTGGDHRIRRRVVPPKRPVLAPLGEA